VLSGGMEIALMVPIFLVLGWLLDRWLGTAPIFMIVMVVLGLVGVFCRLRYSYDQRMAEHEAERLAKRQAERREGSR
jgi:F0F1-type ATP synthase assembly protein I